MREIVLDTETTGLEPSEGHRIIEVACVELFNHLPTGRAFHRYVNPERDISAEAEEVHGLTAEFLSKHPPFAAVVDEMLAFIGGGRLIIHNAEFDLKFLAAEFKRLDRPAPACEVEDTLLLAKRRFPGAQFGLDALCRRFGVDLSQRTKHSAKLDCELLAAVYLELIGGRQPGLDLAAAVIGTQAVGIIERPARPPRPPRPHAPNDDELAAHAALLAKLKQPLWLAAG
ncbi:MAG TPA: DNA polymerase III subunit epsilon [Stellaceae bacterium]|nr:DNA polymerase III subunit epsilon [Stellaceae bacterium]